MKTMISVHFDPDVLKRLDRLAAVMGARKERRVTRAELLNRAAVKYLEEVEPFNIPGPDGSVMEGGQD